MPRGSSKTRRRGSRSARSGIPATTAQSVPAQRSAHSPRSQVPPPEYGGRPLDLHRTSAEETPQTGYGLPRRSRTSPLQHKAGPAPDPYSEPATPLSTQRSPLPPAKPPNTSSFDSSRQTFLHSVIVETISLKP